MAGVGDEVQDYYHRILPFFEEELVGRGDGELWSWAAGTPAGSRVLELGAGTGRATAFLASTAGQVVALELSLEMLAVARRRLAGAANVVLLAADMRAAGLRGPFDLVVAVDDPFAHLTPDEDRGRAFTGAARLLRPGGRFLLDTAWLPPEQREAAAGPAGLSMERCGPGGLAVREIWHCDAESRVCTTRFEYSRPGRPVERASFDSRLWSREELETRAREAGLVVTDLWGDFDRRPWDRETSPRLIAAMRRDG